MITRIFKVDRSFETNTMATQLVELFSRTQATQRQLIEINEFYQDKKNPFITEEVVLRQAVEKELQALFFLGHSEEGGTYGGFSPDQFAQYFDQAFEGGAWKALQGKRPFAYADKSKVKAIYLFGCELGLSNGGKNDSYAQCLANQLYVRGFTAVEIHAIAYEKQAPEESMITEIIWQPGLGNYFAEPGYISAYSVDGKTAKELSDLRQEKEAAKDEKTRKSFERRINTKLLQAQKGRPPIAENVSPLPFLQRAENTYFPNESLEQRKKRIMEDPRNRIVALITQIIENSNFDLDRRAILQALLKALRTDWQSSWQELCGNYAKQYQEKITILGFTRKSNTLGLLQSLSQGKLPPLSEGLESKQEEEKALPKGQGNSFEELLSEVNKLYAKLDEEIKLLRERSKTVCISFFINFEVSTKIQKKASLRGLQSAQSLAELQTYASEALKGGRVTWRFKNTCTQKWGESRTADLLHRILATRQEESYKQLPDISPRRI